MLALCGAAAALLAYLEAREHEEASTMAAARVPIDIEAWLEPVTSVFEHPPTRWDGMGIPVGKGTIETNDAASYLVTWTEEHRWQEPLELAAAWTIVFSKAGWQKYETVIEDRYTKIRYRRLGHRVGFAFGTVGETQFAYLEDFRRDDDGWFSEAPVKPSRVSDLERQQASEPEASRPSAADQP